MTKIKCPAAVEKIGDLTDQHGAKLPPEYQRGVAELIDDDLKPCLEYLNSAIALLEDRIGRLRAVGEMDYSVDPAAAR